MRVLGMRPAASGIYAIGSVLFMALGLVSCSSDVSRFDYPMFAGKESADNSLTTASVNPVPAEPVYQGGTGYQPSGYRGSSDRAVMTSDLPPPGGAQPYQQQPYQAQAPQPYRPQPAQQPHQSQPYGAQPARSPAYQNQSYPQQRVAMAEPAKAAPQPRPEPAPKPAARAPLPKEEPKRTVYTVQRGDTLAAIARRHDVSVADIKNANNMSSSLIDIDDKLIIPGSGSASRVASAGSGKHAVYHVRSGDTLSSIARRHDMDYQELARYNGLRETSTLSLGQAIKIPGGSATADPAPVKVASRDDNVPVPGDNPSRSDAEDAPAPAPEKTRVAALPSKKEEKKLLPDPAPMTDNSFRWPVRGRVIASFGSKPNGKHNDGINVAVPMGTSVKAAENGVVAYAGSELEGYGNLILIRHANGWVSAYAHNDEILVKRGDEVRRGQVISKAGKTGSVSQPQVHFELRKGSQPVDPLKHLSNG